MPGILIRDVAYWGEVTDLLVTDGMVIPGASTLSDDVEVIEGRGLTAIPGLVDVHVHFRDPGLTAKEDLLTGARAAAAGGYTTVLCEPNTKPVIDTPEAVQAFYEHMQALGIPLGVYTKAAVTYGEEGEAVTCIPALAINQATAMSDDGEPLVHADVLVQAFHASVVDGDVLVLTAHCEETPRSAAKVRAALGDGPAMRREVEIIRHNIAALERAGVGRLHIQHISLAESAVVIADAKRRGLAVTAEVTPHHLLLCDEDIPQRGDGPDANWKMNPPLRSRADMLAMRRALAEGVIGMIATDHAPHTPDEKAQPWEIAPFGIIGLETAFGACMSLVHDGALTFQQLVEAMSIRPASLLPRWLQAALGSDLTLVDTQKLWSVEPETFYSKSRNCPFAGMTMHGQAIYAICRGEMVMAEGSVLF